LKASTSYRHLPSTCSTRKTVKGKPATPSTDVLMKHMPFLFDFFFFRTWDELLIVVVILYGLIEGFWPKSTTICSSITAMKMCSF